MNADVLRWPAVHSYSMQLIVFIIEQPCRVRCSDLVIHVRKIRQVHKEISDCLVLYMRWQLLLRGHDSQLAVDDSGGLMEELSLRLQPHVTHLPADIILLRYEYTGTHKIIVIFTTCHAGSIGQPKAKKLQQRELVITQMASNLLGSCYRAWLIHTMGGVYISAVRTLYLTHF